MWLTVTRLMTSTRDSCGISATTAVQGMAMYSNKGGPPVSRLYTLRRRITLYNSAVRRLTRQSYGKNNRRAHDDIHEYIRCSVTHTNTIRNQDLFVSNRSDTLLEYAICSLFSVRSSGFLAPGPYFRLSYSVNNF